MLNALGFLYNYLHVYLEREEGQDFIEYALIVLVGVGAMGGLGTQIGGIWAQITGLFGTAAGGGG